jgi:hypothetical protein
VRKDVAEKIEKSDSTPRMISPVPTLMTNENGRVFSIEMGRNERVPKIILEEINEVRQSGTPEKDISAT